LVEIALSVGKIPLENSSTPPRSSLTEAALANMESFLETLNMVFPAIRVDMFLERSRPAKQPTFADDVPYLSFTLSSKKTGVSAEAQLQDGQWVVLAGSKARASWVGSHASYNSLHAELVSNKTLEIDGDLATFTKDFAFSAPSAAAAVLFGRAANGRTSWVLKGTTMTFANWEEEQIQKEIAP
jgi:hypothetical protein